MQSYVQKDEETSQLELIHVISMVRDLHGKFVRVCLLSSPVAVSSQLHRSHECTTESAVC